MHVCLFNNLSMVRRLLIVFTKLLECVCGSFVPLVVTITPCSMLKEHFCASLFVTQDGVMYKSTLVVTPQTSSCKLFLASRKFMIKRKELLRWCSEQKYLGFSFLWCHLFCMQLLVSCEFIIKRGNSWMMICTNVPRPVNPQASVLRYQDQYQSVC
jgi:hypothetical protein